MAATETKSKTKTSSDERYRAALELWLRWNAASQSLTQRMFTERENPEKIQVMLDDVDRLRLEAVAASERLLR